MDTTKTAILVDHLQKTFRVPLKKEGFTNSLRSLFSREYKEVKAVDDVSFTINHGEMVGFLGPNGAGKTTTLKMLSGILYPTSGTLNVIGHTPQLREKNFQKQISLVMGQKNQLWWDLPPTDTFLLNKDIYGIPDKQYKETVDELVELLELEDILTTQVRKLSLGQRMKCELLASLLHSPKILFLDEPTIGLDIVIQKKVRGFLKEYNRKFNTTIILTSHYMDDVKEVCNRVIMIDHGHKIYDGDLTELIKTYAKEKYLTLEFDTEVKKSDLLDFGKVVDYDGLKATISVPRQTHTHIAAKILETLPVINLDIQEVELEEIIMKVFAGKKL